MSSNNQHYLDAIDPFASRFIRGKVRQLIGQAGFTRQDRDDLLQEFAIDLLRRKRHFDLADAPVPTVGTHHTEAWPDGVPGRLTELGLLVESELSARVLCPECRDHYEEVLACEGPGRATYSFIVCPEFRRVRVSRYARRQWSVHFAGLSTSSEDVAVSRCIVG